MKTLDAILNLSNQFESIAQDSEQLPEDSKDLKTILKNLSDLQTFKARKEYADKNLKRLSSGSARIVYLTPDKQAVVKLASNEKGLAQNEAEANPKIDSKYANPIIHQDNDFIWVIAPFLKKLTEKEFEELTNIPFKDFGEIVKYQVKKDLDKKAKQPDNYDKFKDEEIIQEMVKFSKEYHLTTGDIARISSWGVNKNTPVLIDLGLTREIFKKYYAEEKSKSTKETATTKS